MNDWNDLPSTLPTVINKVWEIRKLPGPRVTVKCNGVKVVDILLSDQTCKDDSWSIKWNNDVEQILFYTADTASDDYIPASGDCFIRNLVLV